MRRFMGLGAALLGAVMFWNVAHAQAPAPAVSEPRFRLVIRSDLSKAFALKEVTYNVDATAPVVKPFAEDNAINSGGEVVLQETNMAPGPHTVNLSMVYVGTGYGVFSYLKGYSFTLKGAQAFTSEAGRELTVRGQAYEKGDVTTELKDKPALRMENAVKDLVKEAAVQQQVKKDEAVQAAAKDTELKTADEAAEARLEALAGRVAELGQRIDTSKNRLGVLQDSALSGSTTAGKANLIYRNEMGSSFKLRELHIFLDGAAIREEVDTTGDTLAAKEEVALYDGRILPGNHTLNVNAVYQGVGYGVFSYLNDFQFKIRSSHTFAVEQGKLTAVKVVAYESGDARTEIKDRPTVRFDSAVTVPAASAPAAPAKP